MTTILVVDDEFLIADILAFALEDEGYMVVKASNGRRALDVFDRELPSLVITDFMMPVMNGRELAVALRERQGLQHLPILLMSGAQAHLAQESSELFDAVFQKPVNIRDIVGAVHKHLVTLERPHSTKACRDRPFCYGAGTVASPASPIRSAKAVRPARSRHRRRWPGQ